MSVQTAPFGRVRDKVAIVTGAASGIGLATLELLVAEGACVVAADIQDEKGALLEQRFPNRVRYARCDVTVESEIAAAVALAKSEFSGLDILFNNAGISDGMRNIADIDAERWDWIFNILLRGPMLGTKHAIPLILERGGGAIINTASVAGLQAGFGPPAYSTAKSALIHFTRMSAAQLSPQGIRVNAICPGLIATSIFGASQGLTREVADQMAAMVAQNGHGSQQIKSAGLPCDIAEAVLYLASDSGRFVTGVHLTVDGGITVGPRHSWDSDAQTPFASMLNAAGVATASR